ncbi:MAG: nucleotidyltransferase domain-containing protein [Ignavibacteria bacterium]|jgi:predicted nucleotidyltransferase
MRLNDKEILIIKESVKEFDNNARVYLFGSRVDDNKKGGDIDLIIQSDKINKMQLSKIRWKIFEEIGVQKIDFILTKEIDTPFKKIAFKKALRL